MRWICHQLNSNIRCIEIKVIATHIDNGESWIVTLDVLKFEVADVERLRRYGWIVTLDVLKWWSGNFLSLFLRVE